MPGTRWFGFVDIGASYPCEPFVLEELERILEAARPASIDHEGSSAIDGSFVIAHAFDHTGDIEIEVHKDWADLDSVYVIDRTRWRNKIIRTTVSAQGHTRHITSGWSRLPIPERFLTHERSQLDYDCNPSS